MKIVSSLLLALLIASCTMTTLRRHAGPTPPDEGCGHCHYLIYKDWKLSYKPYEQVPVPGSTDVPVDWPSYHERKTQVAEPETVVSPGRKDCSSCHLNSETPAGTCTREKMGIK